MNSCQGPEDCRSVCQSPAPSSDCRGNRCRHCDRLLCTGAIRAGYAHTCLRGLDPQLTIHPLEENPRSVVGVLRQQPILECRVATGRARCFAATSLQPRLYGVACELGAEDHKRSMPTQPSKRAASETLAGHAGRPKGVKVR